MSQEIDMQIRDQPDFSHMHRLTCMDVILRGLVDNYSLGVELYVMGALVPEVEGIGDFPEILGHEMPLCGCDQKEGNSIDGAVGLVRGMNVNACWQHCADIDRNLGNWVRDRRNYVEPSCAEVAWHQNCSQ